MILLSAPSFTLCQELFFGFYGEDRKVIWECQYDTNGADLEEVKEELIATLGGNSFVRLSPSQPKDRIVGRIEGMPGRFGGLDGSFNWIYDFGFTITFNNGGYAVKGVNFVGKTNSAAFGSSHLMTAEEWLGKNGKNRQKKWCEAVGVPATEIFQIK